MTKFKIIETQIDNYNDTNNKLTKFEEGFNIIVGKNEVGKSTLMNFIKNILIRKSNSKGYIKYELNGEEINLRAEKNNQKINENLLEKINPLSYKTGFIIDLDDLMFAKKADADSLINIVKDSSGNAINAKQEEYYNQIYGKKQKFSLTSRNIASKTFQDQFVKLNELDIKIKELQSKEKEYNNICEQINILEKEMNNLDKNLDCAELILNKNICIDDIKKTKLNEQLIQKKETFEKIRENYGAIKTYKQTLPETEEFINVTNNSIEKLKLELNKIEVLSDDTINHFELNIENLKQAKDLINRKEDLLREKQSILDEQKRIEKNIEEIKSDIYATERQLDFLEINDSNSYKHDRDLLESYKNNYSDLMNKAINSNANNSQDSNWYNKVFLLLFGGMLCGSLGGLIQYWSSNSKYIFISIALVSVSGIFTTLMKKYEMKKLQQQHGYKKYLDENAKKIIELCNKYNFQLTKNDDFIVQIGTFLQKMNDNLSEYKIVENDLLKSKISLEKQKETLENCQNLIKEFDIKYEKFNNCLSDFISKIQIEKIENYPDIFEKIKEIHSLQLQVDSKQKEINNIEILIENFVNDINNFINTTNLDNISNVNKYDYDLFENVLSTIRQLLDENISKEKFIEDLNNKIDNYNVDLEKYPINLKDSLKDISAENIEILKENLQEKRDEIIRLKQTKEKLEQVTGIVDLKNKKNIELNKLKDDLNKLIQKELIYEIINKAKEKFNEKQPNIICAKEYLSKITEGKYSEINFENRTISGENIGEKDWDNLSRGTKEQLYLALRLGFANNYSKDIHGNPNGLPELPIIIDDAFVNFDYKRTEAIFKCLSDFSEKHQILYFTCHEKLTKNILKDTKIKYNLIELN